MAVDPVCMEEVDRDEAIRVGLIHEFDGELYYFCSPHCLAEFKKHPAGYTLRDAQSRASEEGMPPPRPNAD